MIIQKINLKRVNCQAATNPGAKRQRKVSRACELKAVVLKVESVLQRMKFIDELSSSPTKLKRSSATTKKRFRLVKRILESSQKKRMWLAC